MKFMAGLIHHSLQPSRCVSSDAISLHASSLVSDTMPLNSTVEDNTVEDSMSSIDSDIHSPMTDDINLLSEETIYESESPDVLQIQKSDKNSNLMNEKNHFDNLTDVSPSEQTSQAQPIPDIENEGNKQTVFFDSEQIEEVSISDDFFDEASEAGTSVDTQLDQQAYFSDSKESFLQQSSRISRQIKQSNRRKSDFIVENTEAKETETAQQLEYKKAYKSLLFQQPPKALSSELLSAYRAANKTSNKVNQAEIKEPPQVRIGQINVLIDDQASVKSQKKAEQSTSSAANPFGIRGL